ncbi:hypothetical protein RND81_02G084500 [Saponaria officinalis]|uniref:Uncharacterized protein n=1 Tax=Saponaria officinalis TaxID=3572 RepID=A0AAW1MWU1_SAPOF
MRMFMVMNSCSFDYLLHSSHITMLVHMKVMGFVISKQLMDKISVFWMVVGLYAVFTFIHDYRLMKNVNLSRYHVSWKKLLNLVLQGFPAGGPASWEHSVSNVGFLELGVSQPVGRLLVHWPAGSTLVAGLFWVCKGCPSR